MVRHLTRHQLDDDYEARPEVDERDPAGLIPAAVTEILQVAESWLGWDGRPVFREGNAWTPHKALRRVADHLLDHLAEVECRLAGRPTVPDQWHGRMITTAADFAAFTEVDLDECTSRLTRLAACYQARIGGLDAAALDARPDEQTWTIREVVHHVSGITAYADMMKPLPEHQRGDARRVAGPPHAAPRQQVVLRRDSNRHVAVVTLTPPRCGQRNNGHTAMRVRREAAGFAAVRVVCGISCAKLPTPRGPDRCGGDRVVEETGLEDGERSQLREDSAVRALGRTPEPGRRDKTSADSGLTTAAWC